MSALPIRPRDRRVLKPCSSATSFEESLRVRGSLPNGAVKMSVRPVSAARSTVRLSAETMDNSGNGTGVGTGQGMGQGLGVCAGADAKETLLFEAAGRTRRPVTAPPARTHKDIRRHTTCSAAHLAAATNTPLEGYLDLEDDNEYDDDAHTHGLNNTLVVKKFGQKVHKSLLGHHKAARSGGGGAGASHTHTANNGVSEGENNPFRSFVSTSATVRKAVVTSDSEANILLPTRDITQPHTHSHTLKPQRAMSASARSVTFAANTHTKAAENWSESSSDDEGNNDLPTRSAAVAHTRAYTPNVPESAHRRSSLLRRASVQRDASFSRLEGKVNALRVSASGSAHFVAGDAAEDSDEEGAHTHTQTRTRTHTRNTNDTREEVRRTHQKVMGALRDPSLLHRLFHRVLVGCSRVQGATSPVALEPVAAVREMLKRFPRARHEVLTYDECRHGFKSLKIGLSTTDIDTIMCAIDREGSGLIDYHALMDAVAAAALPSEFDHFADGDKPQVHRPSSSQLFHSNEQHLSAGSLRLAAAADDRPKSRQIRRDHLKGSEGLIVPDADSPEYVEAEKNRFDTSEASKRSVYLQEMQQRRARSAARVRRIQQWQELHDEKRKGEPTSWERKEPVLQQKREAEQRYLDSVHSVKHNHSFSVDEDRLEKVTYKYKKWEKELAVPFW